MNDCVIFNTFSAAEAIWAEIDRLVRSIPEAFADSGIEPEYDFAETVEEDWSSARKGYHFKVTGAMRRQRTPGKFLVMFDMWRPDIRSEWRFRKTALLTFAYSPRYRDGWEVSQVRVGMDGRLIDDEARAACVAHADGRLLEWQGGGESWSRREWLFSIPLLRLDGHMAVTREIVAPAVALLKNNRDPTSALEGCGAIAFAT